MPAGRRAATARVSTVRGAMCRAISAGAPWCSATPAALTRCELAPLRCRGRGSKPTPAPGIHQAHARWASGVCADVFQGVGRRSATRGGPHAQSSQDSFQVGFHQIVVDALRRASCLPWRHPGASGVAQIPRWSPHSKPKLRAPSAKPRARHDCRPARPNLSATSPPKRGRGKTANWIGEALSAVDRCRARKGMASCRARAAWAGR